jgi:DNA-binding NtrC family response regulator
LQFYADIFIEEKHIMNDTILLVDDEPNVIKALERSLLDEQYTLQTAASGVDALQLAEGQRFKVVISDERMPGMDGAEFLSIVKERYPETIRIMLTGYASIESTMRAVNSGEIYRFFTKPWNDIELKLALRSAIEKFDLEEENRRLLKTVKRQAGELKRLENQYPGIATLRRDRTGSVILPDMSEDEVARIIAICNQD